MVVSRCKRYFWFVGNETLQGGGGLTEMQIVNRAKLRSSTQSPCVADAEPTDPVAIELWKAPEARGLAIEEERYTMTVRLLLSNERTC